MTHVLVVVAATREAYAEALGVLGRIVGAWGAEPPRVLSPWEACEWDLPSPPSDAREIVASHMDAIDADWAVLPAAHRRKKLLVADMDSTIIGCECIDELADYAGKKPQIAAITERAMHGELDFEAALIARVAMLKGLPVSVLQQCFDERVRLNPGARTLVQTMAAHGARCVLVSGGFSFFTERVAALAGFHAHRANTLLHDGGRLTGEVARPILGRDAKLAALREESTALGIDLAETLALGDGANDLAMIKAAGLGVAYRAKPIVAAEAEAEIRCTDLATALHFQGYGLRRTKAS